MYRYLRQIGDARRVSLYLLSALAILSVYGCDDVDDDPMSQEAGIPAGQQAGDAAGDMAGQSAGMTPAGQTAGDVPAGQTAGDTPAGQTAGDMPAGQPAGDTPAGQTAGDMPAGQPAGDMPAGDMPGGGMLPPGDPCEMTQPDTTQPCEVTIYDVRHPDRVAIGRLVTVEGTITALRSGDDGVSHIVIQVPPSSPEYFGAGWSGVWVYLNDATGPIPESLNVGVSVRLTGELANFFGQRQLQGVTELIDTGAPLNPLDPLNVDPADVATGGLLAESYEGLLVEITPVSVTEVNPPAGPGDRDPTREFVIAGGLRVNDFITSLAPLPEVGDSWDYIAGVLRLGNGDYKLEPRDALDVGRPIPMGDPSGLVINEVDYSQPGADTAEFIEIANGGNTPAPLLNVTLELVNGSNGSTYSRYELVNAATVLAPGEVIVVGAESVLSALPAEVGRLQLRDAIQNGPDGVRISHSSIGVIDELGYGLELSEGSASVEDADVDGVSNSIGRCGADTDANANDFYVMDASPGAPNVCF